MFPAERRADAGAIREGKDGALDILRPRRNRRARLRRDAAARQFFHELVVFTAGVDTGLDVGRRKILVVRIDIPGRRREHEGIEDVGAASCEERTGDMRLALLRQRFQELHRQAFERSIGVHEPGRMERDGRREELRQDDPLRALPERQSDPVFGVLEVGCHIAEDRVHLHGGHADVICSGSGAGGAAKGRCAHPCGRFQQLSARYVSHQSQPSTGDRDIIMT